MGMGLQANPKSGSLFDGSGGFPLAGALCGIEPVWASEVEPYPIAVTRARFPNMKHLGDISKINGAEIEPVDIITFGSPCQDLSVAGKRAGLKHESNGDEETTRSGLFMEAVRIIKEMRDATNGVLPRFALWENVPGAFSSNKGEDFRIVLEELIKIAEPDAVMPAVPEKGWAYADCYIGDGWSIAYRVFDAQYWGVPQRRRRIHLVADFGGQCAGEVLFKCEGMRGYSAESGTQGEGTSADVQGSSGAADREGESTDGCNGDITGSVSATLGVNCGMSTGRNGVIERGRQLDAVGLDIYNSAVTGEVAASLTTATGQGASNTGPSVAVPYTLKIRSGCDGGGKGALVQTDRSATLATNNDQYLFQPVIAIPIHDQATRYSGKRGDKSDGKGNGLGVGKDGDPMNTITAGDRHAVAYGMDVRNAKMNEEVYPTLQAKPNGGQSLNFSGAVAYGIGNGQANQSITEEKCGTLNCMHDQQAVLQTKPQYIVRRLTPTECARLQGFPDWWGHFPEKDNMTEEEYRFWLEVRNTHARINGKPEKEYTEAQMLTWYNKLHTDSAEYKMWGNGIALPPALYCMQGIVEAKTAFRLAVEALTREHKIKSDWYDGLAKCSEGGLIDANAMRKDWLENGENEYVYDTNAVLDSIDAQPTVDAVPVVHGRWESGYYDEDSGEFMYDYPACGKSNSYMLDFCPNCGAKMDGGSEDGR